MPILEEVIRYHAITTVRCLKSAITQAATLDRMLSRTVPGPQSPITSYMPSSGVDNYTITAYHYIPCHYHIPHYGPHMIG